MLYFNSTNGFRIVFLDSAESGYHSVLPGFGDEVVQPLSELFGTHPRGFDVRNPDAFVGFGELPVVFPHGFIFSQLVDYIFGKDERFG